MKPGYVYVLSNPMLPPDCVKIGLTRMTPAHRALALSKMSAIPMPFDIFFSCPVNNVHQAERRLHLVLDEKRVTKSKEFFRVSPEVAQSLSQAIAAFEDENCVMSKKILLSHTILGAHYQPKVSLRNRNVLYGMIAATVNNSPIERLLSDRRTVVDGFLSAQQVADYLGIQKPAAAKALAAFCEVATQFVCCPTEASPISPVFDMVRYRHGHATWRFSDSYREHFYNPEG
jgi:hypothetical protein